MTTWESSQLKLHYGREQADLILDIVGNIISGQVSGEAVKQLLEKFGKIVQECRSLSINRNDTGITKSKQLKMAVPASKIASLSSGEFVDMVADNPGEKIALKALCAEIINNHEELARESKKFQVLPQLSNVEGRQTSDNYLQIKKDIIRLVQTEIERVMETPELSEKIIRKE
jgi:hypothetical protein